MWMEGEGEQDAEVNGPTFEDLAIDPDLDDVERVVRYSTGTVELQRLVHVMMLSDTAKSAGFQVASDRLFPLVAAIAKDQESVVRQNLCTQLGSLCEFCHSQGTDEAYKAMIEVLIPCFKDLVSDKVQQVRDSASVALIQVADYVREDDLMEHVLSIALELAHDESNDSLRITSSGLLNGLSPRFGSTLCQQFCVPEMVSLSQDPSFKVRRAVAYCMDKILRITDQSRERLLPSFVQLCSDPIWGVRKACADSLALISESVEEKVRVEQLIPLSDVLASDKSKWVRGALSQRLGRFIASLPSDKVPDILIQRFVEMTKINSGDLCWINKDAEKSTNPSARRSSGVPATLRVSADGLGAGQPPMDFASNIMYCCAFNFPAVVLTRPDKWDDSLSTAFKALVMCSHRHVRRTMSCALHEIARLLGPAKAEEALVPVLKSFLLDVDEVRFGVVDTLARFFAALSLDARERHIGILTELCSGPQSSMPRSASSSSGMGAFAVSATSGLFGMPAAFQEDVSTKWRFRHALAVQMKDFCQLFSIATTFSTIVPMAVKLMSDDVETVRCSSHSMVGPCLKLLRESEENNKYQAFQDMILRLAESSSYQERQQYIAICTELCRDDIYTEELTSSFLEPLLKMVDDAVPNVRLSLATALLALSATYQGEKAEALALSIAQLQSDRDRDVALAAGGSEAEWLERYLARENM